MNTPPKRALLSLSDKTGIVVFARELASLGVELISTGGTFQMLKNQGINATEVTQVTQFPEIMDGRVKTLHPKIHGGILARQGLDEEVLAQHDIDFIDIVVVNLYPFKEAIAKPSSSLAEIIENIDIGGPAMVRAAAKNHQRVTVIVNPKDYDEIVKELRNKGTISLITRFQLAVKAFNHTACYDGLIAQYLSSLQPVSEAKDYSSLPEPTLLPKHLHLHYEHHSDLRYGENPHQNAGFYREDCANKHCHPDIDSTSLVTARLHQGKPLSYNNIVDTDTALACVKVFDAPACVIIKHANPCGVAVGDSLQMAYQRAYTTDPTSAFGGIIAFNRILDADTVRQILSQQFVEVIIAPDVTPEALTVCAQKANIRLLSTGEWPQHQKSSIQWEFKSVQGGLLVQDRDLSTRPFDSWQLVSKHLASKLQEQDLFFAWQVARFVKSNAIVYAKNSATVGIGAGQTSRVCSAQIADIKARDAQLKITGSVMASDAFFPFRDTVDLAARAGITAIVQPGGSIRDEKVIAAANEHNIVMMFTGMRHFKH